MIKNAVVVLGFFDAVHKGHRFLIDTARKIADNLHAPLVVCTFDGILPAKSENFALLYSLSERITLIKDLGAEEIAVFPTEEQFLNLSPDEFLSFIAQNNPLNIVVGEDYRFGKGAEGDVNTLKTFFAKSKTGITVVEPLKYGGIKISTTDIKKILKTGDIKQANELLGAPYFICGKVEHGAKNGAKIGFPTANIDITNRFIPKCGVYLTLTEIDGKHYKSITNLGGRPTFDSDNIKAETNLIDFGGIGDLYGKEIVVRFYDFMREIIKFSSPDDLREQLKKDLLFAQNSVIKG